jgi:NAD(P)-dependent dehydrogenase (short-subunit alcohol dehydrogenase family)
MAKGADVSALQAGATGVVFDYSGARVLVTGGTSGIGAATAAAYRAAGAQVTITGTRKSAGDYAADLGGYRYLPLDVTDSTQVAAVATAIGRLDILVHSGGIGLASVGKNEYEPDVFDEAVSMHLTSVYRLSSLCRDALAASAWPGGASIVGIASMSAYFGFEPVPGYGAAKAGLVQLMKTLAVAWSQHGIRANAVAAGLIRTRQTAAFAALPELTAPMMARTPLRRLGEPHEIANAVLFLTSSAAAYITGQTLAVDGGFSVSG